MNTYSFNSIVCPTLQLSMFMTSAHVGRIERKREKRTKTLTLRSRGMFLGQQIFLTKKIPQDLMLVQNQHVRTYVEQVSAETLNTDCLLNLFLSIPPSPYILSLSSLSVSLNLSLSLSESLSLFLILVNSHSSSLFHFFTL